MKKQNYVIALTGLGVFLTVLGVTLFAGLTHLNKTRGKLISPVAPTSQGEEIESVKSISYYILTSQGFLNKARSLANNDLEQTPSEKKAILGQIEKSLQIINEGVRAYPDDDRPLVQRANIYQSLLPFLAEAGQYAAQDLIQAIRINGKNIDHYRKLADLYQKTGNFEGAASAYFNTYRLSPSDHQALYNLAFCLEKSGQIDKAVYYYDRLIAFLSPNDVSLENVKFQRDNLEKFLARSRLEHLSEPGLEKIPNRPAESSPAILGIDELPLEQAALAQNLIIASLEEEKLPVNLNAELLTNAKTGQGILAAGEKEVTVYNQNVSNDKQIMIVPSGDTQNRILYLSAKRAGEWFKVAIDKTVDTEIKFSWWIVD